VIRTINLVSVRTSLIVIQLVLVATSLQSCHSNLEPNQTKAKFPKEQTAIQTAIWTSAIVWSPACLLSHPNSNWLQARIGRVCGRQADRYAGTVHDSKTTLLNLHRDKQRTTIISLAHIFPFFYLCATIQISNKPSFNFNCFTA
jgi:hypothetical protein